MKLESRIATAWQHFFFGPVPADSLGLFRIVFGLVVLMNLVLLAPDTLFWFGEHGTLPDAYTERLIGGIRVNLFAILRPTDATAWFVMAFSIVSTILLIIGYKTRAASICVWLGLVSLHHRNLYLLNSADTLLRSLAFLLMFAPAGRAWSIDRWLRIRSGAESSGVVMIKPWAVRLMQLQVCIMYLSTVMWKVMGTAWLDGSAVFYTIRLEEFARFPIPAWMYSLWFSKLATWGTLAVELSMALLVWIPRLRPCVLFAGAMLHLGLEYSMNIPVFQWAALSSYILFIPPESIRSYLVSLTDSWRKRPGDIHPAAASSTN